MCFSYDSFLRDVLHSKRYNEFFLFNVKKRRLKHGLTRNDKQAHMEQISNSGQLFNLGENGMIGSTAWKTKLEVEKSDLDKNVLW